MQTKPGNDGNGGRAGVVQWVVPPPPSARSRRNNNSQQNRQQFNHRHFDNSNSTRQQARSSNRQQATTSDDIHDYNNLKNQNLNDSGISEDLSFGKSTQSSSNNNINNNNDNSSRPIIDLSVCRTISTFVEVHLRDLSERQQRINQARSKLINAKLYGNQKHQQQQPESPVSIYIAPKDDTKLKVRDEQTKAAESIKQLTNYLKELSYLKRHCDSSSDPIDEKVVTKLSELRTEIIQALNDFVISNSDIELPILDSEVYDYDLCIDASLSKKNTKNIKSGSPNSSNPRNGIETGQKHLTRDPSPSPSLDGSSDNQSDESLVEQAQREATILIDIEKRKREVQKLEKDTIELRKLFSEFYNLVREQGERLETIEENIVITTQGISEGQHHLNRAVKSLTIIMPVTGCMAGALIGGPLGLVIGGKLGGITIGCASSLLGLMSSYGLQRCIVPSKNVRLKLD